MTTSKVNNRAEFDFWKDNKTDQHFTLDRGQIIAKFSTWRDHQLFRNPERGQKWYEYYYGGQLLRVFITDDENLFGLQSVFEESQFDKLYEIVRKHLPVS